MSEVRFEAFFVVQQDGNHFQIKTIDGKLREVELAFSRDKVTNELGVDVVRHFIGEGSEPWFEGSEAWTEDETRGANGF